MSASGADRPGAGRCRPRRITRRARRFAAECGGLASSLSVFMLIVMLMLGGLAVDLSNGVRTRAFLQAVADAAAMSAAQHLPDEQAAIGAALALVSQNAPAGIHGVVVSVGDIEPGSWDFEGQRFRPGGERPDAVRVTARRDAHNANALATLLLGFVGIDRMNVSASAVALRAETRRCSGGGLFAMRGVTLGNANRFGEGFCLHGREGVAMNNHNRFETGTVVSMPDLSLLRTGNNNIGLAQALSRASHDFRLLDGLPARIGALRSQLLAETDLPDDIHAGPVFLDRIDADTPLVAGTLYVVNGDVVLGSGRSHERLAIVATGSVTVGSGTRLHRIVLAAGGSIGFNANVTVGGTDARFCDSGVYSAYLMSLGSITFNSNNTLRGIELAALGDIHLGNNNQATDGIYAEAGGALKLNNMNHSRACPSGLASEVQPAPGGNSRVRTRLML